VVVRIEDLPTQCILYKVVQIWPGQTVTSLQTNSPGHIWTTLYCRTSALQNNIYRYSVSTAACFGAIAPSFSGS
jgi:hypothetical protein